MFRRILLAGFVLAIVVAGVVPPLDGSQPVQATAPLIIPAEWEARLGTLEDENHRLHAEVVSLREELLQGSLANGPILERFPVPDEITLCGERLPLERADVYQRFEEEWTRYLVNQHWMIKWQRRSRDVFPFIEAQLAAAGMPDDLKYVLIVESGLESRAYSSAGAAGWWQFVHSTGKRYGLRRNNVVDERRDLGLATGAAMAYLTKLHDEFQSWPLALSAYNAGEKRVRDEIKEQGEEDFYNLSLPRETEAYWFKAAAIKILMEDPQKYGVDPPDDPWVSTVCDTLQLHVTRGRLSLSEVAEGAGISYRAFRELNPSFRRNWVPRGTHRLVLPRSGIAGLTSSLEGAKLEGRQNADPVRTTALEEAGTAPGDGISTEPASIPVQGN
jgi:membrane-bound lytic murein transglycosylase D